MVEEGSGRHVCQILVLVFGKKTVDLVVVFFVSGHSWPSPQLTDTCSKTATFSARAAPTVGSYPYPYVRRLRTYIPVYSVRDSLASAYARPAAARGYRLGSFPKGQG